LDVTTYRNGDAIPQVTDPTAWANLTTGAWCYYNNDPALGAVYGKLYNWYAVNDPRGLAPNGWHIPSNTEWNNLALCVDASSDTICQSCLQNTYVDTALKEIGTIWGPSPMNNATNSSGFSALPGGYRNYTDGSFEYISTLGAWWTSTQSIISGDGWYRELGPYSGSYSGSYQKEVGMSVRCIKD
jgi:uncharacterized protein (TIGR02145 family)